MDKTYDVIVVGGGLAGLTGAAYSCRAGYRTLLLEKGQKTGGLVNTFWHQGFAFDAGIRAFENSGIILPMLKSLGIEMQIIRNPVSIGITDRWTRLGSKDSLADYADMLTSLFPGNRKDIQDITGEIAKVMKYMDVLYGIDNPLFLDDMRDPKVLKTLLPWLVKFQFNIGKAGRLNEPVNSYLRKFTDNQSLIDMIIQHFFKQTPTFFALSYFGLYLDYSYPVGGMGTLAEKMAQYVRSKGGDVQNRAKVSEVDAVSREVRTADGRTFRYRKLIWAADQKQFYSALAGVKTVQIDEQRRLVRQGQGGDSILTLYIGTDLDPAYFKARSGSHAFYTPVTEGLSSISAWQAQADQGPEALLAWTRGYLARTTYEISCPSLRDPSLAPPGSTGIIVSTLMDHSLVRRISDAGEYEAFKASCTAHILKTLENSLFPGITAHTLFSLCATPLTIERETGNAQGAITGWAFTNHDIPAESRFKQIARSIQTPIPDIFQCGQWTFSPSGLPISILTGKLAADAAIKSLKGKKS